MRWLLLGALFLLVSGGGGIGNGEGGPIQDILVASDQVRAGTEVRLILPMHALDSAITASALLSALLFHLSNQQPTRRIPQWNRGQGKVQGGGAGAPAAQLHGGQREGNGVLIVTRPVAGEVKTSSIGEDSRCNCYDASAPLLAMSLAGYCLLHRPRKCQNALFALP